MRRDTAGRRAAVRGYAQRTGAHRQDRRRWLPGLAGKRSPRLAAAAAAAAAGLAVVIAVTLAPPASAPGRGALSTAPDSYLGVYLTGIPGSYARVTEFTAATKVKPNVVLYYSAWLEPFRSGFATTAARHKAVPLVQINPEHTSLAAIAAGHYDAYLDSYAAAIRSYRHPVILSFGHEMNAWWYSWGYRHVSPAVFVAAWRHVVTVFRARGAGNATWLWTVNVIDARGRIRTPAPWWPGSAYVTWVGIDGYYRTSTWRFAALFGPTIRAVRTLTRDPILIAETGAAPAAGQPAKITDLFAGVRAYGLLGMVWFDAAGLRDWRIASPAALAAFRQGARAYPTPGP